MCGRPACSTFADSHNKGETSSMLNRTLLGLIGSLSILLCSTPAVCSEPLNLVANPLPTLVAEDNEPARINTLITQALAAINLPATLHIDRPAFSGSGLLTGKYDGEYAFLSLNDKRDGFLYSDAYLPVNLYLASRKEALDDISHFSHIRNGRVATENRLANTPPLRLVKAVSWVRNPTVFDSFKQLSEQRAEYLLEDELLIAEFNRLLLEYRERPLYSSMKPIVQASLHLSIRANNPNAQKSINAFNGFIVNAQKNGTYNEVFGLSWISKDIDGDGVADWITSSKVPHPVFSVDALMGAFALDSTKPSEASKYLVDGEVVPDWTTVQKKLAGASKTPRKSYLDHEVYKRMMNRW